MDGFSRTHTHMLHKQHPRSPKATASRGCLDSMNDDTRSSDSFSFIVWVCGYVRDDTGHVHECSSCAVASHDPVHVGDTKWARRHQRPLQRPWWPEPPSCQEV